MHRDLVPGSILLQLDLIAGDAKWGFVAVSRLMKSIYFSNRRNMALTGTGQTHRGQGFVSLRRSEDQTADLVGMPDHGNEVLAAWPIRARQPVVDRPLVCTGPFHDGLHTLVRTPKLGTESLRDLRGIIRRSKLVASPLRKTFALLRKHFSALPRLLFADTGG